MDIQKLKSIVSDRRVILGVASASCLAVGFASGYKTALSHVVAAYEETMAQEIAAAKEYYSSQRVVNDIKPDPKELLDRIYSDEAQAAREAHESYLGEQEHLVEHAVPGDTPVSPEGRVITDAKVESISLDAEPGPHGGTVKLVEPKNVFAGKEPVEDEAEWDYEQELRIRAENPDKPYILHHDEYFENETEYEQGTLTYYQGDDTLVDEKDMPVPDESNVVGDDALTAFGHGSKDKNTIYVRNESLEMDFEIIRAEGKFSVEVLGFDDTEGESLQHAHTRHPNRKFRPERDE
jgi:hypothetical protein